MRLAVCTQALYHLELGAALDAVVELGVGAIELPLDGRSPWVDLDELLSGGWKRLAAELAARELRFSCLSNHQEGQLLLGPHHSDTDGVFRGDAAAKRAFARERLLRSARLASELEVPTLVGFLGAEDYTRAFPWPDPEGWAKEERALVEHALPLLDEFEALGVRFAQEPHPKQVVYDIETAANSVGLLKQHPAWGFNLDPANLLYAGVDPMLFAAEHHARIWHAHAKDAQRVPHNARRSGPGAHGAWERPGRGFRFRIPGWGEVDWKGLISELTLAGWDGHLAIENEDPVFEPLDGLRKAVRELLPLLPVGERRERWW